MVLGEGITKVRAKASAMPEMSLELLYEALLDRFSSYRVSNADFIAFQSIKQYVNAHCMSEISSELDDYNISDVMSFLLVMHYIGKLNDYTTLPLQNLLDGDVAEAEMNLTKHDLFSSDGPPVDFTSKTELAAYIWFYSVISPKNKRTVKAVLVAESKAKKKPRKKKPMPNDADAYNTDWDPRMVPDEDKS